MVEFQSGENGNFAHQRMYVKWTTERAGEETSMLPVTL